MNGRLQVGLQVSVSKFFPLGKMLISLENLSEAVTSFGIFKMPHIFVLFALLEVFYLYSAEI